MSSPTRGAGASRWKYFQFVERNNGRILQASDKFVGFTLRHYKHVSQQLRYPLYEVIKLFTLTLDLSCF
jgi:hypothetical protein